MNEARLERWPADLRQVFAAIGRAMNGKRLTPETLTLIPDGHGGVVAQHLVAVSHIPGTSRRRRGHYIITITGPRVDGRWRFRSGEVETLSRLAAPLAYDPQTIV